MLEPFLFTMLITMLTFTYYFPSGPPNGRDEQNGTKYNGTLYQSEFEDGLWTLTCAHFHYFVSWLSILRSGGWSSLPMLYTFIIGIISLSITRATTVPIGGLDRIRENGDKSFWSNRYRLLLDVDIIEKLFTLCRRGVSLLLLPKFTYMMIFAPFYSGNDDDDDDDDDEEEEGEEEEEEETLDEYEDPFTIFHRVRERIRYFYSVFTFLHTSVPALNFLLGACTFGVLWSSDMKERLFFGRINEYGTSISALGAIGGGVSTNSD